MIAEDHRHNFDTLRQAFANGDVALLECKDVKTGQPVVVLCMVNKVHDEYKFAPVAKFFDGNPYDELEPPT